MSIRGMATRKYWYSFLRMQKLMDLDHLRFIWHHAFAPLNIQWVLHVPICFHLSRARMVGRSSLKLSIQ